MNIQKYIGLLEIEYLKFRKNSVIVVLSILFVIFFPFIILSGKELLSHFPPPFPSSTVLYEFPTVWDYQGYVGNWMVSILLGFFMIYTITSEVSNRTLRQSIINGQTRFDYWISKVLVMVSLSIFATIVYGLSCIILGLIHTDGYDFAIIWDNNFAMIRFFLMSMGYLSMAMLFALWIRKGTLTILVYFSYIMFIELIFRGIHLNYFRNRSVLFYPQNIIEDLMPNPLLRIPDFLSKDQLGFKILLSYNEAIFITLGLISLFIYLSWVRFVRKDV
jgi:ABC-type transport system involved in multi-copper enzyme maturation permease subunit